MSLELVFLETAKLTPTRPFIQCLCDDLIVDAKREVFQTLIGYLFASRGDRRLSIVPNLKSQKDKANDYSEIGDKTKPLIQAFRIQIESLRCIFSGDVSFFLNVCFGSIAVIVAETERLAAKGRKQPFSLAKTQKRYGCGV